uniref:NADH dehydrogenase [ubiquinone] 1 alpha subcomplex subunit 11 n=1 Tax=Philothamnus irregularis TaxID=1899461 RepID=A0A0B8RX27_9SAUR
MNGYGEILDGTNCFRKTWLAGRLGALTGLIASTYHVILYTPETNLEGLMRLAKSTVSMANSFLIGTSSCIGLGVLGAFFKVGRQEGWKMLVHSQK